MTETKVEQRCWKCDAVPPKDGQILCPGCLEEASVLMAPIALHLTPPFVPRATAEALAQALRGQLHTCDKCEAVPLYYYSDYDNDGYWACEEHVEAVMGWLVTSGRWHAKQVQELRGTPNDAGWAALAQYERGE